MKQVRRSFLGCFNRPTLFTGLVFITVFSIKPAFADASSVVIFEKKLQEDFDGDGAYHNFMVKGAHYTPFPIGRSPDLANSQFSSNIYANPEILHRDFSLLAKMYANTITIPFANQHQGSVDHLSIDTLDLAEHYDLKVIAGFHVPVGTLDLCDGDQKMTSFTVDIADHEWRQQVIDDYADFVDAFAGHPAILFWAIHPDDDFSLQHATEAQKQSWYALLNEMAKVGKNREGSSAHPVAMIHRDMATLAMESTPLDGLIEFIDVIGVQALGRDSVAGIVNAVPMHSAKPLWIAGFGADAWFTTDVDNPEVGQIGEKEQALSMTELWETIREHQDYTIGGSAYSYSDAYWRHGQMDEHDFDGSGGWDLTCPADGEKDQLPLVYDQFVNDEWWGLVAFVEDSSLDQDGMQVLPREAYYALQQVYSDIKGHDDEEGDEDVVDDDGNPGRVYQTLKDLEDQVVKVLETLILPVKSTYEQQVNIVVTLSNGDPISYIGASFKSDGSSGQFVWTPTAEYENTIHAIKFAVFQDGILKESKVIFIEVEANNRKPTAKSKTIVVSQNESVNINLEGYDVDEDDLSYLVTMDPQFGTLTGNAPVLTYTPSKDFIGSDHFAFIVSDGEFESEQAHVSILVAPQVNDEQGYVPGQIVVKFRASGPYAVPYDVVSLMSHAESFDAAVPRSGDMIDAIMSKYNISEVEPLYRHVRDQVQNQSEMISVEEMQHLESAFQVRQQARYRPNSDQYQMTDDRWTNRFHIYVIKFDRDQDVLEVIKDFASLPHIEMVKGNDPIKQDTVVDQEGERQLNTKKKQFLDKLNRLRESI